MIVWNLSLSLVATEAYNKVKIILTATGSGYAINTLLHFATHGLSDRNDSQDIQTTTITMPAILFTLRTVERLHCAGEHTQGRTG
jgi:hypothetical protein